MKTTKNNSTGSFFVGQELPDHLKKQGKVEGVLLQIEGEQAARKVSYIMGSASKGWYLTCKGAGPFLTGEQQFEVSEEE